MAQGRAQDRLQQPFFQIGDGCVVVEQAHIGVRFQQGGHLGEQGEEFFPGLRNIAFRQTNPLKGGGIVSEAIEVHGDRHGQQRAIPGDPFLDFRIHACHAALQKTAAGKIQQISPLVGGLVIPAANGGHIDVHIAGLVEHVCQEIARIAAPFYGYMRIRLCEIQICPVK